MSDCQSVYQSYGIPVHAYKRTFEEAIEAI
jgi:hypothetical protein